MKRILSFIIIISMVWQQSGFAQVVPQFPMPAYLLRQSPVADKFHPVHLRSISFGQVDAEGGFSISVDKGDAQNVSGERLAGSVQKLVEYFKIGLALPNDAFWVNLRPDSPHEIIASALERTDVGRILLEADVQLKRDLASMTSPDTAEGRQYWDRLYSKAAELYGDEDIEIPTLMRPWIVPGEIVVGESPDGVYVYKATLAVMLEQDYLRTRTALKYPGTSAFAIGSDDHRFNALNEYSSRLIKELILPGLNRRVNISKRYASLRQVYYSLILAQWVKAAIKKSERDGSGNAGISASFSRSVDSSNLSELESKTPWAKESYYKEYRRSFEKGEYLKKDVLDSGEYRIIRQYTSGGIVAMPSAGAVADRITVQTVPGPGAADLDEAFLITPDGDVVLSAVRSEPGTKKDGGAALLSDSELQAKREAALASLASLLQGTAPDAGKVLAEFFIYEMTYGRTEYLNNPGLLEHVSGFVESVKDLPGISRFIDRSQWFISDRSAYNPILEVFFGAYASLYNNARRLPAGQYEKSAIGYYELEDVPALAKVVMAEIAGRQVLAEHADRQPFEPAKLRAALNSGNPVAVVKTATAGFVPLSAALKNAGPIGVSGEDHEVLEICSKENPDKTGRNQFRVRETTYYHRKPEGHGFVSTPEGFFKKDWPYDPSIWTNHVRGVLRDIAQLLDSTGRDFLLESEGGLYKGTMTGQTDIDTILFIDLSGLESGAVGTGRISGAYEKMRGDWQRKDPGLLAGVEEKVAYRMQYWNFNSEAERVFWKELNTVFMLMCVDAGVGMPSEALRAGILPADGKIAAEIRNNERGLLITTAHTQYPLPKIGAGKETVIFDIRGAVLERSGVRSGVDSGVKDGGEAWNEYGDEPPVAYLLTPSAQIDIDPIDGEPVLYAPANTLQLMPDQREKSMPVYTSGLMTCTGIAARARDGNGNGFFGLAHMIRYMAGNSGSDAQRTLEEELRAIKDDLEHNGFGDIEFVVSYSASGYRPFSEKEIAASIGSVVFHRRPPIEDAASFTSYEMRADEKGVTIGVESSKAIPAVFSWNEAVREPRSRIRAAAVQAVKKGDKTQYISAFDTNGFAIVEALPGDSIHFETDKIATCSGIALRGRAAEGRTVYALAHVLQNEFSASGPETSVKAHTWAALADLMEVFRARKIEDIQAVVVYDPTQIRMNEAMLRNEYPEIVRAEIHSRGDLSADHNPQMTSRLVMTDAGVIIENLRPQFKAMVEGRKIVPWSADGVAPENVKRALQREINLREYSVLRTYPSYTGEEALDRKKEIGRYLTKKLDKLRMTDGIVSGKISPGDISEKDVVLPIPGFGDLGIQVFEIPHALHDLYTRAEGSSFYAEYLENTGVILASGIVSENAQEAGQKEFRYTLLHEYLHLLFAQKHTPEGEWEFESPDAIFFSEWLSWFISAGIFAPESVSVKSVRDRVELFNDAKNGYMGESKMGILPSTEQNRLAEQNRDIGWVLESFLQTAPVEDVVAVFLHCFSDEYDDEYGPKTFKHAEDNVLQPNLLQRFADYLAFEKEKYVRQLDGGTKLEAKPAETLAGELGSDREETRMRAVDFARGILADEDLLIRHEGEVRAYFSRVRAALAAEPGIWLDFARTLAMPIANQAVSDARTMETLVIENVPDYGTVKEANGARLREGLGRLEGLFDRLFYTPERFSLYGFLQDLAAAHPGWPDMEVRIDAGVDPAISSYKEALRDIVTNWMVNAAKYAGKDPRVVLTIRADSSPDRIVVEYEDSGPGLSKEDLAFLTDINAPAPAKREAAGVHSSHQGRQIVLELLDVLGGGFIDTIPESAPENGDLVKAKWSVSLARGINTVWQVDVGAKYSSIKHDIANARTPLVLYSDLVDDDDPEALGIKSRIEVLNEGLDGMFERLSIVLSKQDLYAGMQSVNKDGGIVGQAEFFEGIWIFYDKAGDVLATAKRMPYNNVEKFDSILFLDFKQSRFKSATNEDERKEAVEEIVRYASAQVIRPGVQIPTTGLSLDTLLDKNIAAVNGNIVYIDEAGRLAQIDMASQPKDISTYLKDLFKNSFAPDPSKFNVQRRAIGGLARSYMELVRQARQRERESEVKRAIAGKEYTGPGSFADFEMRQRAGERAAAAAIRNKGAQGQTELADFASGTQDGNDGGKKGGIDFRALPIDTKPATGGISVGTIPLPLVDISQARVDIKNKLIAGGMPYREIKEYMFYCKQMSAGDALSEMAGFLARVLRAEEDAGFNMESPMRELLTGL